MQSKNDSIPDLVDLVEKMLIGLDEGVPHFTRSVSTSARANTARQLLNNAMASTPRIRNIAIALSVYLPLKWAVAHPVTTDIENELYKSENGIERLIDLQMLLESTEGDSGKLKLFERDYQIESSKKLIDLVEQSVDRLKTFPVMGKLHYKTVSGIHVDPIYGSGDVSLKCVEKHYISAIVEMAFAFGKDFEDLFQSALNSRYLSLESEFELLYHNTGALLDVYPKIMWRYQSLIKETDTLSSLYGLPSDVNTTVIDFVKIVRCSIEQIKFFPNKGELYHKVLIIMTEERYSSYRTDQILQELHVTRSGLYEARKDAIRILSFLLWGITTREIMSFLSC